MEKFDTKRLVEASLLSALAALIMVISAYVPILSFVGTVAWAIPITILSYKYDIKISAMALAVSVVISSLVTDPLPSISIGVTFGITSIVLGYCLRKKYSPFVTIIAMAVATFLGYVADIELTKLFTGVDPIKDFFTMLNESIKESLSLMKKMGVSEEQLKQSPITGLNEESIRPVLPGLFALSSVLMSYLSYYLVSLIFRKLKYPIRAIDPLSEWYIPNYLSYGMFFAIIVSMVLVYAKLPNAQTVYSSVSAIFQFAFVVQGLAVSSWFLKSKNIAKGARILLLLLAFMSLQQILLIIGLIDYMFDFRKINPLRRRGIPPRNKS